MEVLDEILADWQACHPAGAVLSAERLGAALERASARAGDAAVGAQAKEDALALLQPSGPDGPPPFELLLRAERGAVHFVRFWHAMHEVFLRLRPPCDQDDEPLADEVSTFRDVFLRRFDHSGAGWRWLSELVEGARGMSADAAAWAPLEDGARQVAAEVRRKPSARPALQLDEVSALVLPWLQDLVEDYRRGSRGAKIFCVLDVTRCKRQDACLHLGRCGWDVELALQSLFADAACRQGSPASSAWSSGGAKLRKGEVECPICAVPYAEGFKSVMTHCCFQVLCRACHGRLTDASHRLSCPFCRGVSLVPEELQDGRPPRKPREARGHGVRAVARGVVGDLVQAFRDTRPLLPPSPAHVPAAASSSRAPAPPRQGQAAPGPARPVRRRAPSQQTPPAACSSLPASAGEGRSREGPADRGWWEERARGFAPACLFCSLYLVLSLCGVVPR